MNQKAYDVISAQLDVKLSTEQLLAEKIILDEGIKRAESQYKIKVAELKQNYEEMKIVHEKNKSYLEFTKASAERGFEE